MLSIIGQRAVLGILEESRWMICKTICGAIDFLMINRMNLGPVPMLAFCFCAGCPFISKREQLIFFARIFFWMVIAFLDRQSHKKWEAL
ncbi:hypothetical protein CEXT_186731 [Caerostris extrusa]|uniref:Uncharacterized protein n=1 Tax=Caerostris extrusa TaxID=172846 RepID=A0AAV4VT80_CAEEX|nr:hypothetical protein CEXT_186731 [Caerostris extrusa]